MQVFNELGPGNQDATQFLQIQLRLPEATQQLQEMAFKE